MLTSFPPPIGLHHTSPSAWKLGMLYDSLWTMTCGQSDLCYIQEEAVEDFILIFTMIVKVNVETGLVSL